MSNEEKSSTSSSTTEAKGKRRRERLQRIGFTVTEAAKMMGKRADALRREIERRAIVEGNERVARLVAGIVARKKINGGRWFIVVPAELRA